MKVVLFFPRRFSADLKIPYTCLEPEAVPSLTALLASDREVTALVLPERFPWSQAHVLSAAKQLLNRSGRLYVLGKSPVEPPPMLRYIGTDKLEAALLAQSNEKPGPDPARSSVSSPPNTDPSDAARLLRRPVLPLKIPGDVVFQIAVAGSQPRIGCTTQALGLWHWCRAVGFDPAIVARESSIRSLASLMAGRETEGGFIIEGIPFVTDAAHAYDCYIRDLGVLGDSTKDAFSSADWSVLVTGVKPWELPATAQALGGIQARPYASVILSFALERDLEPLRSVLDRRGAVSAPWLPQPWRPTTGALLPYDKLLRPVLVRYLRERTYLKEGGKTHVSSVYPGHCPGEQISEKGGE